MVMGRCKDAPNWASHTGAKRESIPPGLALEGSLPAQDLFRSRRLLDKTPVGPRRDGVSLDVKDSVPLPMRTALVYRSLTVLSPRF